MKKINIKLRRDLWSSRWLFLAVVIVILFGVALFESSELAYLNLKSSYDYSYQTLHFADFIIQTQPAPADTVNQLEKIKGTEAVTGRANIDVGLKIDKENGQKLIARAISIPADGHPAVDDLKIESGSYLTPGNTNQLIVEKSFADFHKLKPGDTLTLGGTSGDIQFTVAGIATSPEYIFPAKSRNEFFVSPETWGVVFIPSSALPELTGNSDINEFCVLVQNNANLDSVMAQYQSQLEQYTIIDTTTKDTQPSNAGLKMDLQEFGEIADLFPVLFLFVGAMTTYILITRIVQRQRSQLGLMRALGYSRGQILAHYLSLSLVIGVSGAIIGVVAGYYLADTITHFYVGMLGLPFTVTSAHWMPIEEGLFIGILPSLIAGIFPALAAANLRPAEAMRTMPPATGRKPLLEKIFPFLKNLPLLWKMPLRNIFRNRRRSISTMLGVIFGTVLILSSLGFIDSMNNLFAVQFDQIQTYSAKLSFAQPMPENTVDQVKAWQGVKETAPVLELPATLSYNGESFSTLVEGMPAATDLYGLYTTGGKKTATTEGQILLAEAIQHKLKVETGQTITVTTPTGQSDLTVAGFIKQPMGAYGFVTLGDAQKLAGNQPVITGILLGANAADIPGIRNTASQSFDAVAMEVTADVRTRLASLMNLVYGLMGVMLAFGAILALMVVFTMITISLVERRREIATMRTLGEKSGRISGMITIENIILGIAGLIIGIPVGYGVTAYMMTMFNSDMFTFALVLYARSFVLSAGIIIIIMLISEIPGIRSLSHLNLARVTKEQVS